MSVTQHGLIVGTDNVTQLSVTAQLGQISVQ